MVNSISKTARKHYLIAKWSWIAAVSTHVGRYFIGYYIYTDLLEKHGVTWDQFHFATIILSLILTIVGIISYLRGVGMNNGWPDLIRRMNKITVISRVCWAITVLAITVVLAIAGYAYGPNSYPPAAGMMMVFFAGPILLFEMPILLTAIFSTIIRYSIKKKLKLNHRLPKSSSLSTGVRNKELPKEYTDDSI